MLKMPSHLSLSYLEESVFFYMVNLCKLIIKLCTYAHCNSMALFPTFDQAKASDIGCVNLLLLPLNFAIHGNFVYRIVERRHLVYNVFINMFWNEHLKRLLQLWAKQMFSYPLHEMFSWSSAKICMYAGLAFVTNGWESTLTHWPWEMGL